MQNFKVIYTLVQKIKGGSHYLRGHCIDRWFGTDLGDQFTTVWDLYIHYLAMSKKRFFLLARMHNTHFWIFPVLPVIPKFKGKYPTERKSRCVADVETFNIGPKVLF